MYHISSTDKSKWVETTSSDYYQMVDTIVAQRAAGAPVSVIEKIEMGCGIRYEPDGVVYDSACRSIVEFPERIYWDPQHNLVSSGGVGQYVCNALVGQIVNIGVASLEELDAFLATVTFPKDVSRHSKTFFRDRTNLQSGTHVKAFASETLSLVTVLGLFTDQTRMPSIQPYVDMLRSLRYILDLIRLGDQLLPRVDVFELELVKLHELMLATIPDACKMKPHYMRHIVNSMRKFAKFFTCFWTERKHRQAKSVASYTYNKVHRSNLAHDIHSLKLFYQDPSTYQEIGLVDECALSGFEKCFLEVAAVFGSRKIRTTRGSFSIGEVLLFQRSTGLSVGIAQMFLKLLTSSGECVFVCCTDILNNVRGHVYSKCEVRPACFRAVEICAHCAYQDLGGNLLHVVLPTAF